MPRLSHLLNRLDRCDSLSGKEDAAIYAALQAANPLEPQDPALAWPWGRYEAKRFLGGKPAIDVGRGRRLPSVRKDRHRKSYGKDEEQEGMTTRQPHPYALVFCVLAYALTLGQTQAAYRLQEPRLAKSPQSVASRLHLLTVACFVECVVDRGVEVVAHDLCPLPGEPAEWAVSGVSAAKMRVATCEATAFSDSVLLRGRADTT